MARALNSAFRNLRRAPAFTGLVVLTLALGIGATTAMFSVVDTVVLTPLPFPHTDRVIEVWNYFREGASRAPSSPSALLTALRAEDRLFELVSGYQFGSGTLTGTAEPESLDVAGLAPDIFTIFPASPIAGRLFNESDVGGDAVLISERLWAKQFGRDAGAIGRAVSIDDVAHRVVGVLPPRFSFPTSAVDVWRPIDVVSPDVRERVMFVALRRPDVTTAQIDERLSVVSGALFESGALPKGQYLRHEIPVQVRYGRSAQRTLYLLLGAVSLLLLVACVNASNLLLVRASSEHARLALMAAIGANRSRLLRDAVADSLLLAAAGGAVGLWLAAVLLRLVLAVTPEQLLSTWRTTGEIDTRAVVFAIGVSAVTCLVFGVLPAWRASRVDPLDALKQHSRSTGSDAWQGALVSIQIALVVVLLAGAGLLIRSFLKLNAVDLGFNPDGLATLYVQLTSPRHHAPGRGLAIMRDVERRIETELGMPATVMTSAPIRGGGAYGDVQPEAEGVTASTAMVSRLQTTDVSPDFFEVFQIPLVEGRTFEPADGDRVVIVSEVVARRYWAGASPIGRRFRVDAKLPWLTVVGIARDIKTAGPDDRAAEGMEIYQPFDNDRYNFLTVAVAAGSRSQSVLPQLKRILWSVDPQVPILEAHTLNEQLSDILARPRFILSFAAAFAICAVVIAAVGVYGVSSYWVARRRRELAIRLAIGASPGKLVAVVLGRSLRLSAIGAATGLLLAVAGGRVIASFLFATDPRDPLTLIAVTIALGFTAVAACAGPALKAARVDPMTTLRAE
jgi:putative ABC transport system permease protein